jgi:hypothetical protein
MCGREGGNGIVAVPGLTLRMFWEAGQLKANLGRHNHPTTLWLTVPDPLKALESIEAVLRSGGGDLRSTKS